jgi:hypothetical protein
VSPILGSRGSQATFYWLNEKTLVVAGCFSGTVEEFKEAIVKTHGENVHKIGYFKWLDSVETYRQSL